MPGFIRKFFRGIGIFAAGLTLRIPCLPDFFFDGVKMVLPECSLPFAPNNGREFMVMNTPNSAYDSTGSGG